MDKVFLFILFWAIVVNLIWYTKSVVNNEYYFQLLFVKVAFGLVSGALYQFYYQAGDILHVHNDATYLVSLTNTSYIDYFSFLFSKEQASNQITQHLFFDGEPRTLFFVKIISFFNLFNLSNFWLCSISISILGYCCSIYAIKKIASFYKLFPKALIIAFILFPSVGIWTSGIMKEAIVIPLLLFSFALVINNQKWFKYIVVFFFVYSSFILKYYFVVPLVFILTLSFLIKQFGLNKWVVISSLSLFFIGSFLHPNLNIDKFYDAVIASHNLTLTTSNEFNTITFPNIQHGSEWLIYYLPKSWYYGIFSPLPWQAYSDLSYLQSIQSLFIAVLVFWSIYTMYQSSNHLKIQCKLFLLFILFMAGLLPLCSPNVGSLSRYSVIYLPILISLCLQFYYEQKNNSSS